MDAEIIFRELDRHAVCEQRVDGDWCTVPDLDARAMAILMREREVRFITLTATPEPTGGFRIIYHWDADGLLLNIATTVTSGSLPTISDILPAADWVEREIRDYYALEFAGRAQTPTLMLREGDEPGLFSRTCRVGKDVDPAQTARENATAEAEQGEGR